MSEQIDSWQAEFSECYYNHVESVPVIIKGTTPHNDLSIVEQIIERKIYWFYYPIQDYNQDYWAVFNLLVEFDFDVQCWLSTAEQLSISIGIPVEERNVPDLWVLSIDFANPINKNKGVANGKKKSINYSRGRRN